MALTSDSKELLKDSLYESLFAVEYCIDFEKRGTEFWGDTEEGCLGIPATILLCSLIDTIGSYFRGTAYHIQIDGINYKIETIDHHFFIFNHDKIFNLNLKMETIRDFYSTYRSKLTHNQDLPPNNFLGIDSPTHQVFDLNTEYQITKIYLRPLFEISKRAVEEFIRIITIAEVSEDHKYSKELKDKAKTLDTSRKHNASDTGHTMTVL